MSFLNPVRLNAVLLLPLGLAACGADGADLSPVGLRTTLAAEDRASKQVAHNPVSVDEMLTRARTGGGASTSPAPQAGTNAPPSAATQDASAERPNPKYDSPSPPLPVLMSSQARGEMQPVSAGSAPAANGVHPLWAQMTEARAPTSAGAAPVATGGQLAAVAGARPAKPAPAPIDPSTVVLKFAGTGSELTPEEKLRLDAAVTMRKASAKAGARIVAGPAGEGEPFQRLVLSDRRSQAVDSALPSDLQRSRVYSPEIDVDTVRVEFPTAAKN